MELSKSKLHKILKRYQSKLDQHDNEWTDLGRKVMKRTDLGNGQFQITMPNIYQHQKHTAKGSQLFREIMEEFSKYDVFPPKH